MNYTNIGDIYDANKKIRERFKALISALTPDQTSRRENNEGWTVSEIIEHVAIVEFGITTICRRLLENGAPKETKLNGQAFVSEEFLQKAAAARAVKLEAPDRVHPTGTKSISESLEALDANRSRLNDLRPMFETVDCLEFTFPHPAFGPLTAHDWLALIGGHESRHISQIERILAAN